MIHAMSDQMLLNLTSVSCEIRVTSISDAQSQMIRHMQLFNSEKLLCAIAKITELENKEKSKYPMYF